MTGRLEQINNHLNLLIIWHQSKQISYVILFCLKKNNCFQVTDVSFQMYFYILRKQWKLFNLIHHKTNIWIPSVKELKLFYSESILFCLLDIFHSPYVFLLQSRNGLRKPQSLKLPFLSLFSKNDDLIVFNKKILFYLLQKLVTHSF